MTGGKCGDVEDEMREYWGSFATEWILRERLFSDVWYSCLVTLTLTLTVFDECEVILEKGTLDMGIGSSLVAHG